MPSITSSLRTRWLRGVRRRRVMLSLTIRALAGHRELVGVLLRLDEALFSRSTGDDQPPLGAQLVGGVPRLGLRVVRGALPRSKREYSSEQRQLRRLNVGVKRCRRGWTVPHVLIYGRGAAPSLS